MTATVQRKREEIGVDEWMARAEGLFGADEFKWRFVCPCCGHVQKVEDFRPYKDRGATPASAYQECIGRYTGAKEMKPSGEGPCNYAAYGLFHLSPFRVIDAKGIGIEVFGFDESATVSK